MIGDGMQHYTGRFCYVHLFVVAGKFLALQPRNLQNKNVVNITAQRPNWDLKRDIERKMQRLHRGTMKAIRAVVGSFSFA